MTSSHEWEEIESEWFAMVWMERMAQCKNCGMYREVRSKSYRGGEISYRTTTAIYWEGERIPSCTEVQMREALK